MPQHVIQRRNNRQATFFAEEDYRFYLDCLVDAARKDSERRLAYRDLFGVNTIDAIANNFNSLY